MNREGLFNDWCCNCWCCNDWCWWLLLLSLHSPGSNSVHLAGPPTALPTPASRELCPQISRPRLSEASAWPSVWNAVALLCQVLRAPVLRPRVERGLNAEEEDCLVASPWPVALLASALPVSVMSQRDRLSSCGTNGDKGSIYPGGDNILGSSHQLASPVATPSRWGWRGEVHVLRSHFKATHGLKTLF